MARVEHKDIGDRWVVQATFTVGGSPTDPTNLTVRQQAPDGTETVLLNNQLVSGLGPSSQPVAKPSTGVFKLNPGISLATAGHWYVKFEGTGTAEGTSDFEAIVDPDAFASEFGISSRALVSVGEAKIWMGNKLQDENRLGEIVRKINAASERITQTAGREFKPYGTNPETRTYDIRGHSYIVEIGDLQTATTASSTISVSQLDPLTPLHTFVSTDYEALPRNRKPWQPITALRFNRATRGYYRGDNIIQINGYWGFPAVPEDIKHATLQTIAYWLDVDVEHYRQDYGPIAGQAGQNVFVGGSEPPTVYPLPPEAFQIAASYRRRLVA